MRVAAFVTSLLSLFFLLTPAAAEMKGDVNDDGQITSVDALMALQMSVGKLGPKHTADMNGDGSVTAYDAFKILLLAVGDNDELFLQMYGVVTQMNVSRVMGDERMNWYIKRSDGSILKVGVIVKSGAVVDFRRGELADPTLNVYSNEETVRELLKSKNPTELKKYIKSGDIQLEGVGLVNKVRTEIMSLLSRFF